jgi:hypothetical protein
MRYFTSMLRITTTNGEVICVGTITKKAGGQKSLKNNDGNG